MVSIHSLIHRKVVVLPTTVTVMNVARAMCDHQIGCILICGPTGQALGIVTDRDLACYWGATNPVQDRTIDEVMSRDLVAGNENSGLQKIISLMENHGLRRIPLLSDDGNKGDHENKKRFVGLVTLDDLIAAELIESSQLAKIVRRQVGRRLLQLGRQTSSHSAHSEARSDSHKIQSLQRFYGHLIAATGLPKNLIPQVTRFIIGSLAMRVTLTAAMHFIAQLPERIQEPLLNLPSGPDRSISCRMIVDELVDRFHFTEDFARMTLNRFILALANWMSPGQIDHLQCQLPDDFNPYFQEIVSTSGAPALEEAVQVPAVMSMTSPDFSEGGEISRQCAGEGNNRSPRIEWSQVPEGTKEFALICEDPDAKGQSSQAPQTPWIHWVIYGISGTVTLLPEGLPQEPEIRGIMLARQGRNTEGAFGYQGPLPPERDPWHRYYFHLYALDHEITLPSGTTAEELRQQMKGHVLGEGVLMGRYRRAYRAAA